MKCHLALLVLTIPLFAQAKVTTATLFPSHAQLVWENTVDLRSGSGEVTLEGLPVSLQDDTLMAEIRGSNGVVAQRVLIRQVEQANVVAESTRSLRQALEKLENDIGASEDQIQAWDQQVRLMAEVAGTPKDLTASELGQLAKTVQETTLQALARIREIRQDMAGDLAERDRIQRELATAQQDAKATKSVTIAYQAKQAGEATVRLQFQTPEASWHSQYNARLTTANSGMNGTLALEHLALIRQTTGTDWSNIQLRLSTANARSGNDIPPLYPWVVTPVEKIAVRSQKTLGLSFDMVQSELASAPRIANVVNEGALTQTYRIEAPTSVVSGNTDQFVAIANHDIPVSVETRFFPAMDLNGFIHADGKFDAETSLPNGSVTLYRDGISVGRAYLEGLAPGSNITIGFGVNDRIVAELINEQNQRGEQGIFKGEKYVRRVNRYEITNSHPESVAIRVFDRIPVSQQDDLTVKELEITVPVQRNAQDIQGVLSWERTVAPNESVVLKSGFEVRVPEESELPPELVQGQRP